MATGLNRPLAPTLECLEFVAPESPCGRIREVSVGGVSTLASQLPCQMSSRVCVRHTTIPLLHRGTRMVLPRPRNSKRSGIRTAVPVLVSLSIILTLLLPSRPGILGRHFILGALLTTRKVNIKNWYIACNGQREQHPRWGQARRRQGQTCSESRIESSGIF